MRRISGRCQRGLRYALWALGEATTMEFLEYCCPWPGDDRRQRKNRARAVCLAARKMAIVFGRTRPGGNLWGLKGRLTLEGPPVGTNHCKFLSSHPRG